MNKPKKKILLLATLPPPTHGAAIMNQHVVNSQCINQEFECRVMPLRFAESISDIGSVSLKKIWKMIVFNFRLMGTMLNFKPSLVYFTLSVTGGAFYRDALFAIIIKLFPGRIVYHLHGKGLAEDSRSSSLKRKLLRFIFRNEFIIVLGNSLKTDIEELYSGAPFVLQNGIEVNSNEPAPPADMPAFLFLSNLVISKGIGIFLESLNSLHKKGIDFRAIIAGASYDMKVEEVKKYVSDHNMEKKVEVAGPLYGEAKQKALATSNILVFPSWYKNEAAPLTILEAMQGKLAVIATNNGAIGEIVTNRITGYVVAQKDREAITSKMELLARDAELRRQMGEEGRKKFLENHTLFTFEKNLLLIFQQILK